MRVIPKSSKITATIYKGLTIYDFIVAGIVIAILALIAFTNIPLVPKVFVFFGTLIICSPLFVPFGDGSRGYNLIIPAVSFVFAKKEFKKDEIKKFIPYKEIREDGIIVYPEYFSRVVSVGQSEFRLLDGIEQDARIEFFERILKTIGETASLDLVKIDRPLNFDKSSAALFERVEREKDPVKQKVLIDRITQIDRLNNDEKQYRPFFYLVFYDQTEKNLNSTVSGALMSLSQCKLSAEHLDGKETVNFLKYCHTRYFDEREIDEIKPETYLDYITPKSLKFSGRGYSIDGIEAFTMCIADYPLAVPNSWGAEIFNIDNTKVVLKIRPVEKGKALKRIDKTFNELGSREETIRKASEVVANESHKDTLAETLKNLQNGNDMLFDCTLTITAFNNNKTDMVAFKKDLKQKIQSCDFKISPLSSQQIQGFLASNISTVRSLKRFERGINSSSLAGVYPFVFPSVIDEPNGIMYGVNEYPVVLDITKRGGAYTNSNCLILGKPGSGKSYFAKSLVTQLYADSWKVYVLDVENEYPTLRKSVNGTVIDAGAATQGRINPWHIYSILTEDGTPASPSSVFTSHLNALESFLRITLEGLVNDTKEYINNLLIETYARKGITEDTDCTDFKPKQFPTFDDLMSLIKEKLADTKHTQNPLNVENLQRAETHIEKFVGSGRFSALWNGHSTLSANSQFTVFNFQNLLANKNQIVANAQMLLIMRFLEQEIINTRSINRNSKEAIRTIIVAEEAHAFVDPKFPIALDFLFQMAKRIRKYGGSLLFITQNLGDGRASPEVTSKTAAIFANCQYSFIFQLAPNDINMLQELYQQSGGINETECREITNNPQGTAFMISATSERTSFAVVTTDAVEKMFISEDERKM